jgi:hypothetical protein
LEVWFRFLKARKCDIVKSREMWNTHHVGGQQERLTSMERLRRFLVSSREDSGSREMEEVPSKPIDMKERVVSAVGAAFISAVIVNPLDVAKVFLHQNT